MRRVKIKNVDGFNSLIIRKGYSKKKFAEAAGISQPMFVQISNETRYPSPEMAKRILKVLDVSFEDVFEIVV